MNGSTIESQDDVTQKELSREHSRDESHPQRVNKCKGNAPPFKSPVRQNSKDEKLSSSPSCSCCYKWYFCHRLTWLQVCDISHQSDERILIPPYREEVHIHMRQTTVIHLQSCPRAILTLLASVIIKSERTLTIWTFCRTSHWSTILMILCFLDQMNK